MTSSVPLAWTTPLPASAGTAARQALAVYLMTRSAVIEIDVLAGGTRAGLTCWSLSLIVGDGRRAL